MRRLLAAVSLILAAALPGLAAAACQGANMMAELERERPGDVAAMRARAADVRDGEGLFWRIESPGLAPSYLFGTMHVGAKAKAAIPEAAWARAKAARVFLMEATPEEQAKVAQRMQADPNFAFDLAGPGLAGRLETAEADAVRAALQTRGIPPAHAERMRPWLMMSILAIPPCAAGEGTVDDAMAAVATGPVVGLETVDAVFDGMRALGPDLLLDGIVASLPTLPRQEDLFRTLSDLYAAGRIAEIREFAQLMETGGRDPAEAEAQAARMEAVMVDARNRAWMPRILAETRLGDAFIAVGALHLPGEAGLVALLRAEGLTVTRIGG